MTGSARGSIGAALLVAIVGCRGEPGAPTPTDAPTLASAISSSATPARHAPPNPCRTISLTGQILVETVEGAPEGAPAFLRLAREIPSGAWLELPAATRFTAKDPRTTRETTFLGPGHVQPCVRFHEETWVTVGAFESGMGAGEAPGAEEWVVTPFGVVRYGSAALTLVVTKASATAHLTKGTAFVALASDAHLEARAPDGGPFGDHGANDGGAWTRVESPRSFTLAFARGAPPESRVAPVLGDCTRLEDEAQSLGLRLNSPDADLGALAPRHVVARRAARAACAVASVRREAARRY